MAGHLSIFLKVCVETGYSTYKRYVRIIKGPIKKIYYEKEVLVLIRLQMTVLACLLPEGQDHVGFTSIWPN